MKKLNLILILFLSKAFILNAQFQKVQIPANAKIINQGTKSPEYSTPLAGEIKPISIDLKWLPVLSNISIRHHTEKDEQLELIKKEKTLLKRNSSLLQNEIENSTSSSRGSPEIGSNFPGNINTGYSPLDNSIAISNGGKIVSVANNSIEIYNTNGDLTYSNSIDAFFNDPDITTVCDPVIIYDSGADRFIFFAQECSGESANSNLLVCFSTSNNPNANWWKYKITGHPLGDKTWFDYPKIAVSNNELYITGNSFNDAGDFQQALLYQITKNDGYNGNTLNWQYWYDITANPFTLLPVSYGQEGNYGPGCYLIATESTGSSSIELYDLTDDLTATDEKLNHYNIPTEAYSPAGDGFQFGTSTELDNGDCRALSGFYLNGVIHFVFHSDYTNGYNGINYNRLDVASQKNTNSTFGLNLYEYSYPSVASFAKTETDKTVMIGFGRTGAGIYPEIRVVSCDDGMNWSSSSLVHDGKGYCEYTTSPGSIERWGDYTGISRKHNNTTSTAWMSGMYGTTSNEWTSWIAEIIGSGSVSGIETISQNSDFNVFPNPVVEDFKTEFDMASNAKIDISIYDAKGILVRTLYSGPASTGKNQFSFNKSNLGPGNYFITIRTNHQILKNEKIIIAD